MKMKWVLLTIGLAVGIALIALGTLIIGDNFRASLGIGIEDGKYYILPQSKTAIQAGILITASGVVAVSVSLASMIMFWKRNPQLEAAEVPRE